MSKIARTAEISTKVAEVGLLFVFTVYLAWWVSEQSGHLTSRTTRNRSFWRRAVRCCDVQCSDRTSDLR